MKMMGNCHICGKPANQSCGLCGSITCNKHMEKGICLKCRKGTSREEKHRSRDLTEDDVYR